MRHKIALQPDENILSTLTGLLESFDGTQNVYYGDLLLTNQRLIIVGKKPSLVEVSVWFEEEQKEIGSSSLIVGEHRVTVRWIYNGNLARFMKAFQQLDSSA